MTMKKPPGIPYGFRMMMLGRPSYSSAGLFVDLLLNRGLTPSSIEFAVRSNNDVLLGRIVNTIEREIGLYYGDDPAEITDRILCRNLGMEAGISTHLERAGIKTLGQLRVKSLKELLAVNGIGPARLREIWRVLDEYDFRPDWNPPKG